MNQLPNTKTFDDFLEHYGVLGMKWGVRKDDRSPRLGAASISDSAEQMKIVTSYGDNPNRKSLSRKDYRKTERALGNFRKAMTTDGPEFNKFLGEIAKVNQKYEKSGLYGSDYYKDLSTSLTKQVRGLIADEPNADAFVIAQYGQGRTRHDIDLYFGDKDFVSEFLDTYASDMPYLKHEGVDISRLTFKAIVDDKGKVLTVEPAVESVITHSDITFDDFLEHYGVKGMKWGERKDPELTELDAMLADLMAVNNSNYGPFAYMLAGMDQKKKMQWLPKNFTQMSGKGKESLAKYNSVLHNVNEYMTKNKIVNRPSDPKEQKVWAEKRKKDLAASHAEFLERKQKGQNLINPNVEISARKEVRSDGSVRLSTKPRIDEIVKPKGKKGDPVIPKNPHFPMPIKHSEVVGDFLEHYGVLGMKWGVRKDRPNSRLPKHATFYNTDKATGATTMVDYNPRKVQVSRVAGGGIQVTGRSRKEVKRVSEEIRRQLSNKSEKKSVTSKLNLTDDELRATINRMQLEKTYAQLTATPKQSNAMQQFMVNTGSQILGNAITNVGTEYLKQFLKVNIDKKISPEFRISKLKTEKK